MRDSSQPPWAPGWQLALQPAGCIPALLLLPREQPSHSGQGNIYKQQRGGAHGPVWGRRPKGE